MIARGHVHKGVIVLEDDSSLPEGTPVVVWPETPIPANGAQGELPPEEQHRRLLAAIDRIASLPLEGPSEPFRDADYDQAIYGRP